MDESSPPDAPVDNYGDAAGQQLQWRDLVARIAAGDDAALGELYDASSRVVYSLTLRILTNPTDAEEITLDIYTQVWRTANRFETQRGSVMAWLVTIARSRAIDRLRSQKNRHLVSCDDRDLAELVAVTETPECQSVGKESVRYIRQAIEALPSEQKQAIVLSFFSGFSHPEVAEHLGIPLGTVKTRIRLGMTKLRESLKGLRMEARRAS